MKLTDFYDSVKIPVTSVNGKSGDVVLTSRDVNAISENQIGKTIPSLKNGVVPDSQLPNYAKIVNGKILHANIPYATQHNLGGIQLGTGFQRLQNGVVNALGSISRTQLNKLDKLQIDGFGDKVLTDSGEYLPIGNQLKSSILFDAMDRQYNVYFQGHWPIVGVKSSQNNYYSVTNQVTFIMLNGSPQTVLNVRTFLIAQQTQQLQGAWIAYFSSARIQMQSVLNIDSKYKKLALKKALIYG